MAVTQLIYASRPFGFDDATLNAILSAARHNNARDGVTGALVCRDDLYLHLLEGPEAAVQAAFSRIQRDDRHVDVELIWSGPAAARLFPGWDMRDDPARSWMFSREEVRAGTVANCGKEGAQVIFRRVAADVGEE